MHEDWGECSEDWGGGGQVGGGGGRGRWNFLTEIFFKMFFFGGGGRVFFPYSHFFFKNVPGVLKRMQTKIYHPGVARGRKTIHFFLWP